MYSVHCTYMWPNYYDSKMYIHVRGNIQHSYIYIDTMYMFTTCTVQVQAIGYELCIKHMYSLVQFAVTHIHIHVYAININGGHVYSTRCIYSLCMVLTVHIYVYIPDEFSKPCRIVTVFIVDNMPLGQKESQTL